MDSTELYEAGYLPEMYYNQINKKSAQENYNRRFKKFSKRKNESYIEAFLRNSFTAFM